MHLDKHTVIAKGAGEHMRLVQPIFRSISAETYYIQLSEVYNISYKSLLSYNEKLCPFTACIMFALLLLCETVRNIKSEYSPQ